MPVVYISRLFTGIRKVPVGLSIVYTIIICFQDSKRDAVCGSETIFLNGEAKLVNKAEVQLREQTCIFLLSC